MASPLVLTGCSTESDLADLGQQVLDQTSLVRDQLLAQIAAVDPGPALAALDQVNAQYNQVIAPYNNDAVAIQVGLPVQAPTQAQEEARLEPLGLVMINGIIYALGADLNIESFRKLFFAVGSDVQVFLQLLSSSQSLVVVQTHLAVKSLPTSQTSWTVDQVRTYFSNDAIESVYVAGNGITYAIVPQFLDANISSVQAAFNAGVPEAEIITQVFWLTTVDTTAARVNQLQNLGLDGDETTSVLTDQSVKDVSPSDLEKNRTASDQTIATALSQMQLLNSRFSLLDAGSIENLRQEILTSIEANRQVLLEIERQVRFAPVLIKSPGDIDTFLQKNTQSDLSYLFAQRRSVESIDFTIAPSDLAQKISTVSNIPAGSNTVSSILANNQAATLDQDIDSTNKSWALNTCASQMLSKVGSLRYADLQVSYQCLSSIVVRPVVTPSSNIPVIGYASYDSPSSIITRNSDISITLNIPNIFEEILNLAKPISALFEAAIQVFISMLKAMQSAIDAVMKPLIAKVNALVSQIESFISRNLSYFGNISLNSSILKCALNLDLKPSLPFLDDIAPFLDSLSKELKNVIATISKIVAKLLSELMCLPMNYLNDLLKSVTSYLPSICTADTFKLPDNLQAKFQELQTAFQVQQACYTNFSRNLLRLQASASATPGKLSQFKQDVVCNQSPLNSRFMNVFRLDINPAVGLSSVVSGSLGSVQSAVGNATSASSIGSKLTSLLPIRG